MWGAIHVDSIVGRGTTFKILFPSTRDFVRAPADMPACLAVQGNKTVLWVEDSPPVRKMARIALETYGYHVLEASGGYEAIEMSANHPDEIELVLTDVVMPEVGGLQLADAIASACDTSLEALASTHA